MSRVAASGGEAPARPLQPLLESYGVQGEDAAALGRGDVPGIARMAPEFLKVVLLPYAFQKYMRQHVP